MADIEAKAEAEAAHKGLTGSARRAYIGGVWNRVKQAHAKATKAGGHAVPRKLMNRRARQQAREDARNAMRPHQEAIANIKRGRDFRLGLHRDDERPARAEKTSQANVDQAIKRAIERHRNGSGFARVRDVRREVARSTGLSPDEVDRRIVDLRNRGDRDEGDIGLHFESNEDIMHQPDAKRRPLKFVGHNFDFITLATTPSQQRRQDAERMERMERERKEMFAAHGLPLPEEKGKRQPKPAPTEAELREKRERGLRNFPRVRDRQIRQAVAHGAPDFPPGVGQPKPKRSTGKLPPHN